MAEKELRTRVIQKHDIEENWLKALNFIPKQGEIIVYDPDENYNYPRIKIGDGAKNVNTLPFYNDGFVTEEEAPNLYVWEKLKAEHATSYEVVETDVANVRIGYKLSYKTEWDEVKYADSYELQGDSITLINPTTVELDEDNCSVVLGKYIYYKSSYYKIPSTAKLSSHSGTIYKEILADNAKQLIINSITDTQETKLGYVSSKSFNTYPTNGEHTDGYWYKYIKQMGDSAVVDGSSVAFTETDPTVPAWAKAATKPTYTASEVGALPDTTVIPDALSDLAEDSAHRTVTDTEKSTWNAKANVSDIPTVPTKVSAFENDKGYLTQHQSLSGYAKTSDIPTKTSELTNDSSFATETYVDNKVSNIDMPSGFVAQSEEPTDKTVLWVDMDDETDGYIISLPYGGSKEWLDANGDTTQLYQINGYVWGYVEADGWTRSNRQFRIVSSESEMNNEDGKPYLLRNGNNGTVYEYKEAGGDIGIPVVDNLPETVNDGDIVALVVPTVDSVEQMTDTTKMYELGTSGTIWKNSETEVEIAPPNKFVPSTAILNQRLSGSSASVSANSSSVGSFVTDFISVSNMADISPYNARLNWELIANAENKVVYFKSDKTRIGNTIFPTTMSNYAIENGETILDLRIMHTTGAVEPTWTDVAYVRFQLYVKPSGTSITSEDVANLKITFDSEIETKVETVWQDTGKLNGRKYKATPSTETVSKFKWEEIGTYVEPTEAGWDATSETHTVIDSIATVGSIGDSSVYSTDGYLYTYIVGAAWMEMSKYEAASGLVDKELSFTSTNAIQNKVVTAKLDELEAKVNSNDREIDELNVKVANISTGSETVSIPSFWQDAVDECIARIKALQVGRNCITFPFFSDNHQRNGYAGILISHIMKECHIPYCFYGGDSISSGYIADEATMIAQDKAFDAIMSYVPNGRFCRAVGNHDGFWNVSSATGDEYHYTRDQVYELFMREESIAQNKHFGDDGTYYYVDEIASKVRFVVLNTNGGSFDSTQLAWLQNTALNFTESGWAVVLFSHQPLSNHYHAGISNATEVISTIQSYVDGNSANKADIIGCFSGHIHRDRIYTGIAVNTSDDSVGDALPFKQVTITSDHTSIAYDDATKHTVASDDQSHAIDFVTINKTTKTVNLTRLGIGEDRSYTY